MATKIDGLDRLKRKLGRFPEMARREIAKAMEQSAQEVVEMAKRLAPIEDGDLRDSIGWNWYAAPPGSMVLGEVRPEGTKGAGNMAIVIYAGDDKAFYARWVEFGTRPHVNGGIFAGTQHPGSRAHPFFFPSWRAMRKRAKSRVSRAITKAAKAVAAGG